MKSLFVCLLALAISLPVYCQEQSIEIYGKYIKNELLIKKNNVVFLKHSFLKEDGSVCVVCQPLYAKYRIRKGDTLSIKRIYIPRIWNPHSLGVSFKPGNMYTLLLTHPPKDITDKDVHVFETCTKYLEYGDKYYEVSRIINENNK